MTTEWNPTNLNAPPIYVLHAELTRYTEDSAYRSLCPVCKTGVLMVNRHPATFELLRPDRCTHCGQVVVYEDTTIAGEYPHPLPDEDRKILERIGD
jgi:hypothetical protein